MSNSLIRSLPISAFFVLLFVVTDREILLSFGLMDGALNSLSPSVRATTENELAIARAVLAGCAVLTIVFGIYAQRIQSSRLWRALKAVPDHVPDETGLTVMFNFGFWVMIGLTAGSVILEATGGRWLPHFILAALPGEDRLIEWLQFVFFLAGSGHAFLLVKGGEGLPRLTWAVIGLGLLFIAGEEISWGQRFLRFETPENLAAINLQQEFNLHNIGGFIFDHMFTLMFLVWGIALPIAYSVSATIRRLVRVLGIPIPSLGLAIGMGVAAFTREQTIWPLITPTVGMRAAEIREFLSAVALYLLMRETRITFGVTNALGRLGPRRSTV